MWYFTRCPQVGYIPKKLGLWFWHLELDELLNFDCQKQRNLSASESWTLDRSMTNRTSITRVIMVRLILDSEIWKIDNENLQESSQCSQARCCDQVFCLVDTFPWASNNQITSSHFTVTEEESLRKLLITSPTLKHDYLSTHLTPNIFIYRWVPFSLCYLTILRKKAGRRQKCFQTIFVLKIDIWYKHLCTSKIHKLEFLWNEHHWIIYKNFTPLAWRKIIKN